MVSMYYVQGGKFSDNRPPKKALWRTSSAAGSAAITCCGNWRTPPPKNPTIWFPKKTVGLVMDLPKTRPLGLNRVSSLLPS